jgi:hypothetical protein
MNSRFEPIWSNDRLNIVKIVNIAANISSVNTHIGPFSLLIRLIGNGFRMSNTRKITIDNNIDIGE